MRESLRRDRPEPPVWHTTPPKKKSMHGTIIQLKEGSEDTVVRQVKAVIKSNDLTEAKVIKSDKCLIIGSNSKEHQKDIMSKLAQNQALNVKYGSPPKNNPSVVKTGAPKGTNN